VNVLVLHSELGVLRGGGENFTRNLFTAFARRGHRVSAAFVTNRRGDYPIALPGTIKPIPIRGWWSRNFGKQTLSAIGRRVPVDCWFRPFWNRVQEGISWRVSDWHARRFQRRVQREIAPLWIDFDSVYVHGDVRLASEVARYKPTVLRLPGPVSAEMKPLLDRIQAVCANGDALVRIREFLGHHAIELPVGIDVDIFTAGSSSIRAQLGWSDNHFVIGYAGRLSHIKGVDILTAAFRQIINKNQNFRLLIVGDGEEQRPIKAELSREIAAGLVHLEPGVEHERLCDWYRAMSLMVMPSRYENFSNSVLEALACGTPFLGADVGGNRMIAQCGVGWLFESGSFSSLAAQIEAVFQDKPEREARGTLARQYVKNHHLWSASAERLEQVLQRLVEQSR
jgi:glycosyltransferase involved in cell wall biosynthesis